MEDKFLNDIKKKYKFSEKINRRGQKVMEFEVGQIDVPSDFKGKYLRIRPDDKGNQNLIYIVYLGLDPKIKEARSLERKQKRLEITKAKTKLYIELKKLNKLKRTYMSNNDFTNAETTHQKIEELREQLSELRINKK